MKKLFFFFLIPALYCCSKLPENEFKASGSLSPAGDITMAWENIDSTLIIDKIMEIDYPESIEELANIILSVANNDCEIAFALYFWIINFVEYDYQKASGSPVKLFYIPGYKETAKQAFRKEKAVCEGYSALYCYLADLCGLEAVFLYGITIGKNYVSGDPLSYSEGHAWNAVCINYEWFYVDCTWEIFFPESLSNFNQTHIPYEKNQIIE